MATLSRFISKAINKYLSFFKVLKGESRFRWIEECEEALHALKKHIGQVPLLSKPKVVKLLLLYLAVTAEVVNSVLIGEEKGRQLPVYYISKDLLAVETHYTDMKKLALALITASGKLRPYFQAHAVKVLTNFPLK